MENLKELTLAELVSRETASAGVFEKFQLDFCCKGKRSLEEACENQGIDLAEIVRELEAAFSKSGESSDSRFLEMELDELANYIVDKHHSYVREMVPRLIAHTSKVAGRHGEHNPNLVKIAELWKELAVEMMQHMDKEEKTLFPAIGRLVAAHRSSDLTLFPRQSFVANPIRVMEIEHDRAGSLMDEIKQLSNNFTPPLIACTTYRLSYYELKEFGEDLHRHVHLENYLLFPKVLKLEETLRRAPSAKDN